MASSKQVVRTQAFLVAAQKDLRAALATVLLGSFGVQLDSVMDVAQRIIADGNDIMLLACFIAGVNIHGSIGFASTELASQAVKYPELFVVGRPGVADSFNFSAMRAVGHAVAHKSPHPIAKRIVTKAGSCITGANTPDSIAGRINKETSMTWLPEHLDNFTKWSLTADQVKWVNAVLASLSAAAASIKA